MLAIFVSSVSIPRASAYTPAGQSLKWRGSKLVCTIFFHFHFSISRSVFVKPGNTPALADPEAHIALTTIWICDNKWNAIYLRRNRVFRAPCECACKPRDLNLGSIESSVVIASIDREQCRADAGCHAMTRIITCNCTCMKCVCTDSAAYRRQAIQIENTICIPSSHSHNWDSVVLHKMEFSF